MQMSFRCVDLFNLQNLLNKVQESRYQKTFNNKSGWLTTIYIVLQTFQNIPNKTRSL